VGNGWERLAGAWIDCMGETGDWGSQHVLDPLMLERVSVRPFACALDVGCGEGRFCRMLKAIGTPVVGIDPTEALLAQAKKRDPGGEYQLASAEALPFASESFDLVISYLTLIDIADFRAGLREMVRVLRPNGSLLIANLNSFFTSCSKGWVKDLNGEYVHYPVDRYLEEFAEWVEWSGIRVENWHRPLASYMRELIAHGLTLTFFDEPQPRSGTADHQQRYRRAPWFMVMEWRRVQ